MSYLDKYRKAEEEQQQPDTYTNLSKYRKQEPVYLESGGSTNLSKYANPVKSVTSAVFEDAPDPYDTFKIEKQIDNARMRVEDAGGQSNVDNRNGFEKMTNLPKDQNWLFDAFDIIGRPQQAFFGAVDAVYDKNYGDIGKQALEGVKGTDRRLFKDFIDPFGKFTQENLGVNVSDKLGLTEPGFKRSAMGLTGDIIADPINFVPIGAIPKLAKLGANALSVPLKAGRDLAESAIPALKNVREQYIEPAIDTVKDGFGNVFKYQNKWDETLDGTKDDTMKNLYNDTENNIQYMSENSLRDITKAARESGGVKGGDDVGRIMEKDLKQFEDVKGYEFPDGVTRTENKGDLLDAVKTNRDLIANTGKAVNATGREFNKAISQTAAELERVEKQIRQNYFSRENAALRQLNARKNKPLNIDELAQSKAFGDVSVSPKFNLLLQQREGLRKGLETLRTDGKIAKSDGIGQIGKLKEGTEQLKGSLKNPVMIQKELPRPVREMSTDPKIKQAADNLIKSNDTIREWARGNDIPVGEIEGYMRHILSAEEKTFRQTRAGKLIDSPRGGMNNPDKGVLKGRELMGSAEDVNERLGKKLFETNAYFSTAIGQRKLIEYGNAAKFRKDVLSNPSFAKPYQKGIDPPPGAEVINLNNYSFLKGGVDDTLETVGGEYVVTKGVRAALDRYKKLTDDDGINAFLKAYDTGQSFWKRATLLSLPYHIRNDIGAKFNSYIAGMNLPDMTKYSALATKDITNALGRGIETPMYNEFRKQGLSSSSQMAIDFAKHGADPEKAITKIVKDQSRTGLQKAADVLNPLKIFDNSQKLGVFVDQSNRYALYRWGRETKNMSPEEAAALVRETQFDYSRITKTEKEVFARMMPFYRWSRNNIPFQLRKFAENPARYSHVNKLRQNMNDSAGLNEETNGGGYTKDNFFMPVTSDGQGAGYMMGANLPIADLTKLANPAKLGADSASALLKLPIELGTNTNLFKGGKLKQFEGEQKKFQIPKDFYGVPIPGGGKEIGSLPVKTAYALEQLGGQPVRALSRTFGVPTQKEAEDNSLRPTLGIGTMLKKYDIKENNFYQKKKELRELMEYLDYLEQETGERARSTNDIKRGR